MQSARWGLGGLRRRTTTRCFLTQLPLIDFGAVIDPPTADVTAHIVEMLACERRPLDPVWREALQRGTEWSCPRAPKGEHDGSYWGRWGVNYVYGTGAAVPALGISRSAASGPTGGRRGALAPRTPEPLTAAGEKTCAPMSNPVGVCRTSTASQTAWAVLLCFDPGCGRRRDKPATERGVEWLVRNQTEDGTWDRTMVHRHRGSHGDFSLNYHLYRHVFPLTALGRYVFGTGPAAASGVARRAHGKVRRSDRAGRSPARRDRVRKRQGGRPRRPSLYHRLLVLAPLRIEQLALGPGGRVGPMTLVIERIGAGLAKAPGSPAGRLSSAPPLLTLSPWREWAAHLLTSCNRVTWWSPNS